MQVLNDVLSARPLLTVTSTCLALHALHSRACRSQQMAALMISTCLLSHSSCPHGSRKQWIDLDFALSLHTHLHQVPTVNLPWQRLPEECWLYPAAASERLVCRSSVWYVLNLSNRLAVCNTCLAKHHISFPGHVQVHSAAGCWQRRYQLAYWPRAQLTRLPCASF